MNIFSLVNVALVYVFGLLRLFPEYLLLAAVTYLVVGITWAMMKRVRPPRLVPAAPPGAVAPPPSTAAPTEEPAADPVAAGAEPDEPVSHP